MPDKEKLGELFKSSTPVNLTEMETEIFVRCTKHVFSQHLVLQFDCTNTLQDQLLENISVSIDLAPEAYEVTNVISCSSLGFEEDGSVYVILTIPMELSDWTGTISPTMKFTVRDCDATTGKELDLCVKKTIWQIVHSNEMSIQYILDQKMLEWASKNVVGITCPIDQTGWSKKDLFLNEYSNVFHQNPQSEILKVCLLYTSDAADE